jgi:hypothetical protein
MIEFVLPYFDVLKSLYLDTAFHLLQPNEYALPACKIPACGPVVADYPVFCFLQEFGTWRK